MRLLIACALGLLGCGVVEHEPAVQSLKVPGGYHLARMTPGHAEHLALSGEKRVPCRDCHALADAGFAAPSVEICAGCHAAQQRQHHPLDGGVAMTCLTCHVFRAETPGVRFEKWACMNCHREAQGEKAPISVHVERCASCHRPHDVPFTEPADCSTCHDVTVKHGKKGDTEAQTCMACHPPHSEASLASQQCLGCHTKATMPAAARVSPQTLFRDGKKGHLGCGSCHATHLFEKRGVKPCASCHQDKLVLAPDSHDKCVSCHLPHQARAQPKPCEQCHQKIATGNKHPETAKGVKCTGCHVPHPAVPTAVSVACISCHKEPAFTGHEVHAATLDCDSCHAPHTGKPKPEALCVTCHEKQLAATKLNKGHADCKDCHAGLPHADAIDAAPKPCLSCHEDKTPPQKGHAECSSCHASHSAAVTKTCVGCHVSETSAPLPGLHAIQKHRECAGCHAPHTPEPARGPAMCTSCHKRLQIKTHPTAPTQCVGCHLFKTEK